jgi:hypothetical protein
VDFAWRDASEVKGCEVGDFPNIPHFRAYGAGKVGEAWFPRNSPFWGDEYRVGMGTGISDLRFQKGEPGPLREKNITPLYTGPKVHVLYLFLEKSGGNYFWGVRLKRI